jgi:hypothetical protein
MALTLRLGGESAGPDELRSLRTWLISDEVLRGSVQTTERPPRPGSLGPTLEALQIVGDPAAAALAWAVVTWLRNQRHDLTITLSRKNDEMSLTYSGKRLKKADNAQIQVEIATLAAALDGKQTSEEAADSQRDAP